MNFNFIRMPIKLTEYEWLQDNGLNYNATVLWSHLLYYCSWNGDSWITMGELFDFIGIEKTNHRPRPKAWNDFLMALNRFDADGFIKVNADLSKIDYETHVTIKINEFAINKKYQFVVLPSEVYQKIRDFVPKEVTGDVILMTYLFIGSHLFDDGWCHHKLDTIRETLHVKKEYVSKAINFLLENNLIVRKVIRNQMTGKCQNLYAPNSIFFSNKMENK